MSTIKCTTLQNLSGVEVYTCKAWVNFNGTGTVAIRASGNVSSITDNGVGDYTVNFSNALQDQNYAVAGTSADSGGNSRNVQMHSTVSGGQATLKSTTQARIIYNGSGGVIDSQEMSISIFR